MEISCHIGRATIGGFCNWSWLENSTTCCHLLFHHRPVPNLVCPRAKSNFNLTCNGDRIAMRCQAARVLRSISAASRIDVLRAAPVCTFGMVLRSRSKHQKCCSYAKVFERAQESVKRVMRKRKKGTLKSSSGRKVTSKKQAIAMGLSEAREKGAKVPKKKKKS